MQELPATNPGQPRNKGIVVSCIALLTLGLLSPVSLFLSIKELRQPPMQARSILAIILSSLGLMLFLAVLSVLLVFALGYRNYQQQIAASTPKPGDIQIGMIAEQWSWTSVYPGPDGLLWTDDDVRREKELVIPENTKVYLSLKSDDVLHCLFIPSARLKKDVLPGRINAVAVDPMTDGEYDFFCTEYCGADHSLMIGTLHVVPDRSYHAKARQSNLPANAQSPQN